MADFITGIIFGSLGMFIFAAAVALIIMLVLWIEDAQYGYVVRINNITGGQIVVDWTRAKKIKHNKLGTVYYLPKYKKEGRQYANFFGSQYEYPMSKGKKKFLPLMMQNDVYVPEEIETHEKVQKQVIVIETTTDKNGKIIKTPVSKTIEVTQSRIKAPKSSMRQFNLTAELEINDDYGLNASWWAKYGHLVAQAGVLSITAVICIMMLIFTYQLATGVDVTQAAPAIQAALNASQNAIIPPA